MNRPWMMLAVAALGLFAAACSVTHRVAVPGPVTPTPKSTIVGISTNAGEQVNFDAPATPAASTGKSTGCMRKS